jgi:hypothetical protein
MAPDLDVSGKSMRRHALIVEAQGIERAAWVWSVLYRRECRWWRRLNTFLLILTALLAAVSGGVGFSQLVDRRIAAAFALSAAAVAGVSTVLGAAVRATSAEAAASANMTLVEAARPFYLTVAPYVTLERAVAGFERLCKQRDQVIASAPMTHLPIHKRRFRRLWAEAKANQAARLAEVIETQEDHVSSET